MLMYADDTTLFCNICIDINDNKINRQLNTISEWLLSNKLSLNIKKTKYMVFHTNQTRVLYPNLYLNMMNIERFTQSNFRGIVLSSNLKWNKHTDHISKGPKEYSLHVVELLLLNAAQIVLTRPAPRNGGPFLQPYI